MAKRSQRSFRTPNRRFPQQPRSGDLILIVCEGEKTEPDYFRGLIREWKIAANVVIVGEECDSAPISVVDYAIEQKKQAPKKLGVKYDEVWCVFDHDQHSSLNKAMDKARKHKLKIALSVPCFEFWYLLHFVLTTKPFIGCQTLIKELKKHVPDYDKSKSPFSVLLPLLDIALKNAAKVKKNKKTSGSENPFTDVDLLVQKLESMVLPHNK